MNRRWWAALAGVLLAADSAAVLLFLIREGLDRAEKWVSLAAALAGAAGVLVAVLAWRRPRRHDTPRPASAAGDTASLTVTGGRSVTVNIFTDVAGGPSRMRGSSVIATAMVVVLAVVGGVAGDRLTDPLVVGGPAPSATVDPEDLAEREEYAARPDRDATRTARDSCAYAERAAAPVRDAPSEDGVVIARLALGDQVEVVRSLPGWTIVRRPPADLGFVASADLTPVGVCLLPPG